MKKYNIEDGVEYVFPKPPGEIKLVCCDCGLTHDVDIKTAGYSAVAGFILTFNRNNRSTAQRRRFRARR